MTHSAIAEVVYDAMPEGFQRFMRFSDLELHYWSHVPDEVDHDNLLVTGGCAIEEAYSHSYKMAWDRGTDTFTHLTGSGPTVLAQTARLAKNATAEGNFDEAREFLARSIHVSTDLTTIWHLTRELTATDHEKGELAVAKVARKLIPTEVSALAMPNPHSLYLSIVAVSQDTVRQQLDRVSTAQGSPHGLASDPALITEMLTRCASWSLTVLNYCWTFVERDWK